jgi:hypothetical protein
MDVNANIIPRGQYGVVQPVGIAVRYVLEYSTAYMQDRLRADLFVNGSPVGIFAIAVLDDDFIPYSYGSGGSGQGAAYEAVRRYGADLERAVMDELVGHSYRRRVQDLEDAVRRLESQQHRVRWWHLRTQYVGWRLSRFGF